MQEVASCVDNKGKFQYLLGFSVLGMCVLLFRQVLQQMSWGWIAPTEENMHSLLSLFLLGIVMWKSPASLLQSVALDSRLKQNFFGMGLLVFGLLLYFSSTVLEISFLQQLSFILTLWSLLAIYWGRRPTVYGLLLSMFLIQSIPWLIITPITFPLKTIATEFSAGAASLLGWPVTYTQNLIQIRGMDFQMTSPCSGLHSIVGLTFVWFLASMTHSLRFTKVLLYMPVVWVIAIIMNALRLFMTISWGLWIRPETALAAHDVLGYVTFAIGLVFILGLNRKVASW